MLPDVERPEELRVPGLRAAIGVALRAMRDAEGLTQTEVAWRMRVSDKTVARIERGLASFEMIDRYLRAVEKTSADLLGSTATPPYRSGKHAAPPGRHLAIVTKPATRRASLSVDPASDLGPRAVAAQQFSSDGVTPIAKRSRPNVPRTTPTGRR